MTSVGFNTMVHLLLGSNIRDHQCGFKAFRHDRLAKLIPYVQARGWTWDTEVLAIGQRCGYTIEEIPEPETFFPWVGRYWDLHGGYALLAGIRRMSNLQILRFCPNLYGKL